jgi:multidrug resistance efflux pump
MMRRIFLGFLLLTVVAVSITVIIRPHLVDKVVHRYDQFRKYSISQHDTIYPESQERKHIVRVNNARLVAFDSTELSFPVSGVIAEIEVKEGMTLKKGQHIASLDTQELLLSHKKAVQSLAQVQSTLDKIKNGTRKEDVAIYESRASLAMTDVYAAREDLLTKISNAYTVVDNDLWGKFQSIVSMGRNTRPRLEIEIANTAAENDIIAQRERLDSIMDTWSKSISSTSTNGDIVASADVALISIRSARDLYDTTGAALHTLRSDSSVITSARTVVNEIRVDIDMVLTQITDARSAFRSAGDAYRIAQDELTLKKAGSEIEDIRSADALVEERKNTVLIAEDKISKATLFAPMDNMVVKKIYPKVKEVVQVGQEVVLLAAHGFKFEVDVPEEDIGYVSHGDTASIVLRSYPAQTIMGEVLSIEENEIIKNGDTYFRVSVMPDIVDEKMFLRTGMTGEVNITTGKTKEVYALPSSAIQQRGAQFFILTRGLDGVEEVRVVLGPVQNGMIQILGTLSTSTPVLFAK